MHQHIFPDHYGEDCVMVSLDKAFVPLIVGQIELMLQRKYWSSDDDWYKGHSAASEAIAAMATNCAQQITDSIDRLYRLHDTAFNSQRYTVDANGVIQPPIPVVPFNAEDNSGLAHLSNIDNAVFNFTSLLRDMDTALHALIDTASGTVANYGAATNIFDVVAAIQALQAATPNLDYTSVLGNIQNNTLASAQDVAIQRQLQQQNICCGDAVTPTVVVGAAPASTLFCQYSQAFVTTAFNVIDLLFHYAQSGVQPSALVIKALADREFKAKGFANGISGIGAQQLVQWMIAAQHYSSWRDVYLNPIYGAVVNAGTSGTDPDSTANAYDVAIDTNGATIPFEVKMVAKSVLHDIALTQQMFVASPTIDISGTDPTFCGGSPPPTGTEVTLFSDEGLQANPSAPGSEGQQHQYLQFNSGAPSAYFGATQIDDAHVIFKQSTYDPSSINNPMLGAYFNTDWGGVAIKILTGPSDVSLIFPGGGSSIGLSSSSYTTLSAGTTNFLCYSPGTPEGSFSLDVIFPV